MIEVSDMYLAATLLAYGAKLENIDRDNPRRQLFKFSGEIEEIWVQAGHSILRIENPDLVTIERKYIGGVMVYPPRFIDCLRKVKAALHGVV
jgi:hypothetical protein